MVINDDFWAWVDAHIKDNPSTLRLKYHRQEDYDFDIALAILQIECRQRFGKKIAATLERDPHFLFPTALSGEQSTSDALASYHATLVHPAEALADLTSGLGIDAIHCSAIASSVSATDINPIVAEALAYNAATLGIDIDARCADCRDFITDCTERQFGTVFIDPARRDAAGGRIYALADCKPDVVDMMPRLEKICKRLIIKASPMLDVTMTSRELPQASRIIALGTATECKELLAVCDFGSTEKLKIEAVTLNNDGSLRSTLVFSPDEEHDATAAISMPVEGMYLYEPYPAVMKAAPMKLLCERFGVAKPHPNTHVYLSDKPITEFPGTIWHIDKVLPFASKHLKRLKKDYPAISVATRNFDMPADTLRRKLGVADATTPRLLAITAAQGQKLMLILSQLQV